MKSLIRKSTPKFLLNGYHKALSIFAAWWYKNPSDKLIVIGITGTNGKSTTANLIAKILEFTGAKVGLTSTVNFKIGDREWLNPYKMTMLGRFALQKLLREMVDVGCKYAVIETSSEGVAQSRHLGINYDVAVFLNLTPEHIESHGGFENYKKAKGKLFKHLTARHHKIIDGQKIPKTSIVNLDSEHADYFLKFDADQKIGFVIDSNASGRVDKAITAKEISVGQEGSEFKINDIVFKLKILGKWNVSNALAAISVGDIFGINLEKMSKALEQVEGVPGRLEKIDQGQNFKVIIDYAPQPQSLAVLYDFLKTVSHNKLIHVLGSAGGGRDKSRRSVLGQMAGRVADYVIVTNEDPYDEDPMEIINAVRAGAEESGKIEGENLFSIFDRREAIRKALSLAKEGDLVLLTGKGSEQAIVVKNREKIPWDERVVVKEELEKILS